MYLFDNPVLQRELLVNLRMNRAFVLLLVYETALAAVVYFAWPSDTRLVANSATARGLVNMFFLGQYVLASLMAPSFAAATITGEKERRTYELLLATPLKPGAITMGKLVSSLAPLALLIVGSLPIVMLCLPLGGVSFYEVLAAYLGLIISIITFGMISVACSSYFTRTVASLVASYLLILPLALVAILIWMSLEGSGETRLFLTTTLLPGLATAICMLLFFNTKARLLRPPDVGSEGKDVVDIDREAENVVGLVIQRDKFPDKLFAPPKRTDVMEDGTNPVYDKEIHSEIFSQGTLMLRLVIQISMFLAIPLMAGCLFLSPQHAPWYVTYVIVFNMLVGPVFSAGSLTSERERKTLDLLLTTTLTPWTILSGKLLAGLRVSSVLTMLVVWPLLLAIVMVNFFWHNLFPVFGYFVIILVTCLTTANCGLLCSALFQKTTTSLMTTYLVIMTMFCLPVAATVFHKTFVVPPPAREASPNEPLSSHAATTWIEWTAVMSPFATSFSMPLSRHRSDDMIRSSDSYTATHRFIPRDVRMFPAYVVFSVILNTGLLGTMIWLLNRRWRVSRGPSSSDAGQVADDEPEVAMLVES
jgi:ABC-type transport system involved in multi-copper enzyme maturation permease subunit